MKIADEYVMDEHKLSVEEMAKWTWDAECVHQIQDLGKQVRILRAAVAVPRRLGDASPADQHSDKKNLRRLINGLINAQNNWIRISDMHSYPLTIETSPTERSQGAQLHLRNWTLARIREVGLAMNVTITRTMQCDSRRKANQALHAFGVELESLDRVYRATA